MASPCATELDQSNVGGKTNFFCLISPHKESPDFSHFIYQLGTVIYRNHMVLDRQGSAAHEIQKIIESLLVYGFWLPKFGNCNQNCFHWNCIQQRITVTPINQINPTRVQSRETTKRILSGTCFKFELFCGTLRVFLGHCHDN